MDAPNGFPWDPTDQCFGAAISLAGQFCVYRCSANLGLGTADHCVVSPAGQAYGIPIGNLDRVVGEDWSFEDSSKGCTDVDNAIGSHGLEQTCTQ